MPLRAQLRVCTAGAFDAIRGKALEQKLLDWHDAKVAAAQDRHPLLRGCRAADCKGHVVVPRATLHQTTPIMGECSSCRRGYCCVCFAMPHPGRSCFAAARATEDWGHFLRAVAAAEGGAEGMQGTGHHRKVASLLLRLEQGKADREYTAKHCRRCPGCARLIEKLSGCDSMICGRDYHSDSGLGAGQGCGCSFKWSQLPEIKGEDDTAIRPPEALSAILDTTSSHLDVAAADARSAPKPFMCTHCTKPIEGTLFECVTCGDGSRLCWACLRMQLGGAPEGSAVATVGGEGSARTLPRHVEHLFAVVQPPHHVPRSSTSPTRGSRPTARSRSCATCRPRKRMKAESTCAWIGRG